MNGAGSDAQVSGSAYTMNPIGFVSSFFTLERVIWFCVTLIIGWLALVPLAILFLASLKESQIPIDLQMSGFTLKNYYEVITSSVTYRLLLNSLIYTACSVGIALFAAGAFAYLIQRTDIPFRRTLLVLLICPLAIPAAVSGMAWTLLGSPSIGFYNVILRALFGWTGRGPFDIYSMPGMVMVTAVALIPSFYLILSPVINRMDPSLEEASEICGVSKLNTIRRITLPLLAPAFLGGVIFFFIIVIETFEIPAILGMPKRIFVFSTLIYQSMYPDTGSLPNYGTGSVYGVITLGITTLLLLSYKSIVREQDKYTVVTGKGYRPSTIKLSPAVRWAFFAVIAAYIMFFVIFPLLILIWASIIPYYTTPSLAGFKSLTFNNYIQLVHYPGMSVALQNTALLVFVGASGATILAALASRMAVRGRIAGRDVPEQLSMFIIAIPGIVLAMALQIVYTSVSVWIYGTIWIIVIACITRFLANGTRILTPAYLQIHPALEEASGASGVSPGWTTWRIQVPLLTPALATFWLWAAIQCMREIPMSIALSKGGSQTIGVLLWNMWTQSGNTGLAAALAVVLTIVSAGAGYFVVVLTLLPRKDEN